MSSDKAERSYDVIELPVGRDATPADFDAKTQPGGYLQSHAQSVCKRLVGTAPRGMTYWFGRVISEDEYEILSSAEMHALK